jgi:hypothetical protein
MNPDPRHNMEEIDFVGQGDFHGLMTQMFKVAAPNFIY